MNSKTIRAAVLALPILAGVYLCGDVLETWLARLTYPYDLEWMEGGVLAHAWRLQHGKQIYVDPGPEFIPMIYPPGYPGLVALFGSIFGISHGLGRALSILGTTAAATAIGFILHRQWKAPWAGFLGAAIFLGTYPRSGAFMDMVRPDALFVGLTAWSAALVLEKDIKFHRIAGLLLCAAFIVKHNAAFFGFPLAIGLWARSDWRTALRFGLWAALPALVFVGWAEWWTGGLFLTWILEVPQSHPMAEPRVFPGSLREMGNTMGITLGFLAVWVLAMPGRLIKQVPFPLAVIGPTVGAAFGMWWFSGLPRVEGIMPPSDWEAMASYAFIGAAGAAVPLVSIDTILRAKGGVAWLTVLGLTAFSIFISGILFEASWRIVLALPLAIVLAGAAALVPRDEPRMGGWAFGSALMLAGWITAALMRGHHGGFINVYMILHWCVALGMGVALADIAKNAPKNVGYPLVAAMALAQLGHQISYFKDENYEPTEADVAAGDEVVAALARIDGPILAPYSAWMPAQAGHEPSWHLISLWDIRHRKGPFIDNVKRLTEASQKRYWGGVLESGDQAGVGIGIRGKYRKLKQFRFDGKALMPRTGWRRRPNVLWVRQLGSERAEDIPSNDTDL